jgi:hypothetical protein
MLVNGTNTCIAPESRARWSDSTSESASGCCMALSPGAAFLTTTRFINHGLSAAREVGIEAHEVWRYRLRARASVRERGRLPSIGCGTQSVLRDRGRRLILVACLAG